MGRRLKQGLDYFTMDVDFFESIKIRRIIKNCGNQSIPILIVLLCNIYRDEGYYVGYNDDLTFLIAEQFGVSEGAVEDTVRKSVAVEFFDSGMFEKYKILTSHAIQERYFLSVERLKRSSVKVIGDFILQSIKNEPFTQNLLNKSNILREKSNNLCNKSDKVKVKVKEKVEKDIGTTTTKFKKPTLKELQSYCQEKGYTFDADAFIDYYESNGWRVGRNPMRSWKAACSTWQRKEKEWKQPEEKKKFILPDYYGMQGGSNGNSR